MSGSSSDDDILDACSPTAVRLPPPAAPRAAASSALSILSDGTPPSSPDSLVLLQQPRKRRSRGSGLDTAKLIRDQQKRFRDEQAHQAQIAMSTSDDEDTDCDADGEQQQTRADSAAELTAAASAVTWSPFPAWPRPLPAPLPMPPVAAFGRAAPQSPPSELTALLKAAHGGGGSGSSGDTQQQRAADAALRELLWYMAVPRYLAGAEPAVARWLCSVAALHPDPLVARGAHNNCVALFGCCGAGVSHVGGGGGGGDDELFVSAIAQRVCQHSLVCGAPVDIDFLSAPLGASHRPAWRPGARFFWQLFGAFGAAVPEALAPGSEGIGVGGAGAGAHSCGADSAAPQPGRPFPMDGLRHTLALFVMCAACRVPPGGGDGCDGGGGGGDDGAQSGAGGARPGSGAGRVCSGGAGEAGGHLAGRPAAFATIAAEHVPALLRFFACVTLLEEADGATGLAACCAALALEQL
eukprot:g3815.t1